MTRLVVGVVLAIVIGVVAVGIRSGPSWQHISGPTACLDAAYLGASADRPPVVYVRCAGGVAAWTLR